jgi:F-type H+-transporting ATPase subunit alpha
MYCSLLAATEGIFDKVPVDKIKSAEESLLRDIKKNHSDVLKALEEGSEPSEIIVKKISSVAVKVASGYNNIEGEKE